MKEKFTLFFVVFFCSLFLLFFLRTVHADLDLKFHWKFDEGSGTVANDSSGNTPDYPGTIFNNPTPTWVSGGGLTFDGINDYVRTDSPIPNSMGVSDQAYTLSASVRIAPGETDGNIIHISDGANGVGWCIAMLHLESGKFRAIGWNNGAVTAIATQAANTNQWYSIANTWSPVDKELRLYVNGDLVASTPMNNFTAANQDVYVFAGLDPGGCDNNHGWFKGDIKDVRIYSKAITQEEAQDNSNQSIATPTPTAAPTDTPAPTAVQSNNSSQSNSSSSCTNQAPNSAPDLFQVTTSPTTATLYFTPVNPNSEYIITYGPTTDANKYAVAFDSGNTNGAISYVIKSLAPNTSYYFKIQGKNGCKTGDWSQTKQVRTTTTLTEENSILTTIKQRGTITVTHQDQTTNTTPQPTLINSPDVSGGYNLNITVVNNGKPVEGAEVEIHSVPQRTKTDKNGIARFTNVEKGNHTVLLAYQGYNGKEEIMVDGSKKEVALNFTVQMNPNAMFFSTSAIVAILCLTIIIGLLIFFLLKNRKQSDKMKNMLNK